MSLQVGDRVKETSTTSGTGTLNLAGAVSDFQTFVAGIGNGNTCPYLIDDGVGNWELCYGVVASGSPATITRGTIIASSSGGGRITFGSTSKTVACVLPSELFLWAGVSAAIGETAIASATTTDLGTITTMSAAISGTTTITGFGTQPNTLRYIRFTGTSLVLTYNATSLITPTGANIQTAAGDTCVARSDGSGNWTILNYQPYGGIKSNDFAGASIGNSSYTQVASLSLPPGSWILSGAASCGNTVVGWMEGVFSTTTASNAGSVIGKTQKYEAGDAVHGVNGCTMPRSKITLTATTTYYFNMDAAGTTPGSVGGTFMAERVI